MIRTFGVPAILTLAILCAPRLAGADTTAVVVSGDPGKKAAVIDAIAPWLQSTGASVVLDALPETEVDRLVDCFLTDDEGCAGRIAATAGTDKLLFVMVQLGETDAGTSVQLTGWLFASDGGVLAAERRGCEDCRVETLTRACEELAAALFKATATGGTLRIASSPAGARVLVDGQPVGVTPLDYKVAPGEHTLSLDLDGFELETRTVVATSGATQPVDITMRARTPQRSMVPWLVIGAGAAAVIAGGILFAMDEDNPPPDPMRPRTFTDTGLPAVTLGLVGAATVGVGIYLKLRAPRRESAPVAGVTGDTVVLGWQGRF
jgi:hypothetical protein